MKKFLFTIVAALLAVPSFAQLNRGSSNLSTSNVYFGARLGMATATLTGDIDLGTRLGLTLGGVIGMEISDNIFMESGLYYSERGAKKGRYYEKYNTVEVPLIVKYGFTVLDGELGVLPFLGPVFSHAISGKSRNAFTGDEKVGTFDEKRNDWALMRNNMGIKLGCGVEFKALYAELAYQFGVTNLCKDEGKLNLADEGLSSHSNALLFNVGVNF